MCLLGKGKEGVDKGLTGPELEHSIIDECRRCLDQIVHHAQSEQPLFQQMEQAAERAGARLKRCVESTSNDHHDQDEEEEGWGRENPSPPPVVASSSSSSNLRTGSTVRTRGSNVRKRIAV